MTITLGFVVAEFNRDLTYQMELLGREHNNFWGQQLKRLFSFQGFLICLLQSRNFARGMISMPWLP